MIHRSLGVMADVELKNAKVRANNCCICNSLHYRRPRTKALWNRTCPTDPGHLQALLQLVEERDGLRTSLVIRPDLEGFESSGFSTMHRGTHRHANWEFAIIVLRRTMA